MSLGRHEEHRTLALRPAPARGACLHCVRAGQYEVRVLQYRPEPEPEAEA